jgi:hypothetical protein
VGNGLKFPVTVAPGRNGPVLTATADWLGLPIGVPVNTHRTVFGHSTTVGINLSPLAMSDQVAAGTPGRFGDVVVEVSGDSVEVVVEGGEPTVMDGELGEATWVDAGACAGPCTVPQAATSAVTARIVTGINHHRLVPNRVIIVMKPQTVDDAFEKGNEQDCRHHAVGRG